MAASDLANQIYTDALLILKTSHDQYGNINSDKCDAAVVLLNKAANLGCADAGILLVVICLKYPKYRCLGNQACRWMIDKFPDRFDSWTSLAALHSTHDRTQHYQCDRRETNRALLMATRILLDKVWKGPGGNAGDFDALLRCLYEVSMARDKQILTAPPPEY